MLLEHASLVAGLHKYGEHKPRQRGSGPKLQVLTTALMSAQSGLIFSQACENTAFWGHLVESAVGAHLANSVRSKNIQLFYWKEGNCERRKALPRARILMDSFQKTVALDEKEY